MPDPRCGSPGSGTLSTRRRTSEVHHLAAVGPGGCAPSEEAARAFRNAGPKSPGRGTTRSRTPAALAMLKRDHNEVKALFKAFERASGGRGSGAKAEAIARQICLALTVHAKIEEEIFYPAAREAIRDADLLDEAMVEHASARELIAQIEGMRADDPLFKAKVTVLGEYVNHHVREEEKEMFPAIRPRGIDLDAIAEQMMARREELMGEAGAK